MNKLFPRRLMLFSLTFTLVLEILLSVKLWQSKTFVDKVLNEYLPLVELSGAIINSNSELERIIAIAVQKESHDMYQDYLALHDAFDVSISDVNDLLERSDIDAIEQVKISRSEVKEEEEKIFSLIKEKRNKEAALMLNGDKYQEKRLRFINQAKQITETLSFKISDYLSENIKQTDRSLIGLMIFIVLSVGIWVSFYLTLKANFEAREKLSKQIETERAKSTENARLASLGVMAGGIAHEINNPLAIIEGRAYNIKALLKKLNVEDEKVVYSLQSIIDTSQRIHKIVRALLHISRADSKDQFINKNLNEIIDEVLEVASTQAKKFNIAIKFNKNAEDSLIINCQPVQIAQMILNLIQNSIQAVQNNPERWIEISLERVQNNVHLVCLDSGLGISSEILPNIMEPFFTTKPIGQGTGLGLSIAKSIVESHGGEIYVDTHCKNTKFVVVLPLSSSGEVKLADEAQSIKSA